MRGITDKIILAGTFLGLLILAPLVCSIAFPAQAHQVYSNTMQTLGDVGRAVATGVVILFFVGLVLTVAHFVIEHKKNYRVIRPSSLRGHQAQAVIYNNQVIHLSTQTAQMDPLQMLEWTRKAMQISQQAATLARREDAQRVVEMQSAPPAEIEAPKLPTYVPYEEIRDKIPRDHILVGIGRRGLETKEKGVGACVWIVGLSGTGKTSTTVLRIDERATDGHYFLGVDPHWFKDESLFHAIYETLDGQQGPYASRFLKPMACTPTQQREVLQAFLDEFNGRKAGRIPKPWRKITLLVDEVGALMDPTTEEEEAIKEMLPSIARICGQEARNFLMGGIFISQQATYLAWLRKVALMVIVHQLLQESEKRLATNNDTEVMEAMKSWPIGRTYVFGVGFTEGPRTVQQPVFQPRIVDADSPQKNTDTLLPHDFQPTNRQEQTEANGEAGGSSGSENGAITDLSTIKILREIGKRLKNGDEVSDIVKSFGLPYGRATQELKATVEFVQEQMKQTGEL